MSRALRAGIRRAELARGHDGFLRGKPEPVFVLGVYVPASGQALRLLTREVVHVPMASVRGFPSVVEGKDWRVISAELPELGPALLLALAMEVDSGRMLETAYARLEQPDRFHAWRVTDPTPEPVDLGTLAEGPPHPALTADRLRLLWDRDPMEATAKDLGDDWVGAAAVALRSPLPAPPRVHRLHFVSEDERNDWTLEIQVGARW